MKSKRVWTVEGLSLDIGIADGDKVEGLNHQAAYDVVAGAVIVVTVTWHETAGVRRKRYRIVSSFISFFLAVYVPSSGSSFSLVEVLSWVLVVSITSMLTRDESVSES